MISRAQHQLFEALGQGRLQLHEAIELTAQSLLVHGAAHRHWSVAWSGGKDSTATLTVMLYLIASGRVDPPERLTVLYADTRQELPPLYAAALGVIDCLRGRGIDVRVCRAPLDKRFLVYILGRGVPPPNNNTLRWCTRQIKLDPMTEALATLAAEDETVLTITGVRQGESAVRDGRIAMSCGINGAECGQGWYQEMLPNARGIRGRIATLAPLLHWRVCNVWDWLIAHAPEPEWGSFPTRIIAHAYGGDEAEEANARTGCIGCPLASQERALEMIVSMRQWAYLAPLLELKPLYRELRLPENRLRKAGRERRKDGSYASNPQRMGPLTFEARLSALSRILDIQERCNRVARERGRPLVDILNAEEASRIRGLIDAGMWPDGWDGSEPLATVPLDSIFADGSVQPLLV